MMQRIIFTIFLFLFLTRCSNQPVSKDKESNYKYLHMDDTAHLAVGDSALIVLTYPQGTAYYDYAYEDTTGIMEISSREKTNGNPDEMGGGMSESFYLKAKKQGFAVIRIWDQTHRPEKDTARDGDLFYKVRVE